jgi:CheY-like chemotaxis protein
MRALLVDDHPTSRALLVRSLTSLGLDHLSASSGPDAVEILKSGERFDFVIADHHMPGMSGARFLQSARDQGWLRGTREETRCLLLCSGPPPREDCQVARILLKPLAAFQLAEALTGLLDEGTAPHSPDLASSPPLDERETLRILVAEDNLDSQFLMRMYLKRAGYDAVVVANGKEAVAAWENGDFSLILMDGQMPEMDGLEAAACIRERERGSQRPIPIIAVTACADESDRERFLRTGMTDYLTKPIAYADLVDAIERCRYAAPAAA